MTEPHPDLKFVETPEIENFEKPNDEYFIKYQVVINKNDCKYFINNKGKTEKGKTQLPKGYLTKFNKLINEYEKTNVKLSPKNGIMYLNPIKSQTNFIQINAYCVQCKQVNKEYGKYRISIKDNPNNETSMQSFLTVNVDKEK